MTDLLTKVKPSRRAILPIPTNYLIGAEDSDGGIVIGTGSKTSSKKTRTRLRFLSPDGEVYEELSHKVAWQRWKSENTLAENQAAIRTLGLLKSTLQATLNSKLSAPFDRGGPAIQVISGLSVYLYLYEAGPRGALWPRYKWRLPCNMSPTHAIWWALHKEIRSPNDLIALPDMRMSAEVEGDPDLHVRTPSPEW
jgi:hypothetical protein